jgi:hypothetical protein
VTAKLELLAQLGLFDSRPICYVKMDFKIVLKYKGFSKFKKGRNS